VSQEQDIIYGYEATPGAVVAEISSTPSVSSLSHQVRRRSTSLITMTAAGLAFVASTSELDVLASTPTAHLDADRKTGSDAPEVGIEAALQLYINAFKRHLPTKGPFEVLELPESTYQLTIDVSPDQYEDSRSLIQREQLALDEIWRTNPSAAGFFAIRYRPRNDLA
jgi:hypothetical protein